MFDTHSLKNLGNFGAEADTVNALKNWYNSLPGNSVAFARIGDSSKYIFAGGTFMLMAYHSSNEYGVIYIFSYWEALPIKKIIIGNGVMKAPVDA